MEEIISYESASGTLLLSLKEESTVRLQRIILQELKFKYELGGVSLRRINKPHDLNNVTATEPRTFDTYKVKLDMGTSGVGRSTGESFQFFT